MHSHRHLFLPYSLRELGHILNQCRRREYVLYIAFLVLKLDSLGFHHSADSVCLALFHQAVVWEVVVVHEQGCSSVHTSWRPSSRQMPLHLESHLVLLAVLVLVE